MSLAARINDLFENPPDTLGDEHLSLFDEFKDGLNAGGIRAAEKIEGQWRVNLWVKRGILLGFKLGRISNLSINDQYEIIDVCQPPALDESTIYAKEAALIEDIKSEIAEGRKVQVFATFTGEHDVTLRLKTVLEGAGFRVAVMKSSVPTESREAWYKERLREGVIHAILRDFVGERLEGVREHGILEGGAKYFRTQQEAALFIQEHHRTGSVQLAELSVHERL